MEKEYKDLEKLKKELIVNCIKKNIKRKGYEKDQIYVFVDNIFKSIVPDFGVVCLNSIDFPTPSHNKTKRNVLEKEEGYISINEYYKNNIDAIIDQVSTSNKIQNQSICGMRTVQGSIVYPNFIDVEGQYVFTREFSRHKVGEISYSLSGQELLRWFLIEDIEDLKVQIDQLEKSFQESVTENII